MPIERYEALKIARIAYKEMIDIVEKWNTGLIDFLPINFHWDGCLTIGAHSFEERELTEYQEYD